MSDAYAEQAPTLLYERAFYVGNAFAGVLVGVNSTVGLLALYHLQNQPGMRPTQRLFYSAYVLGIVALMVIAFVGNAYMGQRMWIDNRFVDGGPFAYFVLESAAYWNILGSAADIVVVWMGDALLLYRCYVIWSGSLVVVGFPILMFLASVALSLCVLIESALPTNQAFFAVGTLINFTVPWIALSSALNVILTALICARILHTRAQLRAALRGSASTLGIDVRSLAEEGAGAMYTSVMALLVESAAPLALIGIVTCVLVGKASFASTPFLVIWGTVAGISPLLIVARIAMGLGWARDTSSRLSTSIAFAATGKRARIAAGETTGGTSGGAPFHPSESTFAQRGVWQEGGSEGSGSKEKIEV